MGGLQEQEGPPECHQPQILFFLPQEERFPPPTCDSSANTGGRSEAEQGAGPAPKPVTASDFALWEAVSCSDRILPTLRLPCWVETHPATRRGSGVFAREGDGVCVPVGGGGSGLRQVKSQHHRPGAHRILGNSKAGCFKPLCFGEVCSHSDGKLKQLTCLTTQRFQLLLGSWG